MARLSSVVLPLPRKPVRMVTGVCGNARSLEMRERVFYANIETRNGHCERPAKAGETGGLKLHAAPRIAFRQRLEAVARDQAEAEPGAAMQEVRIKARALATLQRSDVVGRDEGQHLARTEIAGAFGDLRHRRGHDAETTIGRRRVGVFQKRFAVGKRQKAADFSDEGVVAGRKEPLHVARRRGPFVDRDKAAARAFFNEGAPPCYFQALGEFALGTGMAEQRREVAVSERAYRQRNFRSRRREVVCEIAKQAVTRELRAEAELPAAGKTGGEFSDPAWAGAAIEFNRVRCHWRFLAGSTPAPRSLISVAALTIMGRDLLRIA